MEGFDYAGLERRVAALEARQPATLRHGRVTSVDGGKVRVELGDGQNTVTHEMSTLQNRVLRDQDIKMPDIGEPVAVMFSGQGNEDGVILGAYYNKKREKDPGLPSEYDYHRYADGTEIWYDRANHKLVASVAGDVDVASQQNVTVKAAQSVDIQAGEECKVLSQEVKIGATQKIKMRAPKVEIYGDLYITGHDGEPGKQVMNGTLIIKDGMLHIADQGATVRQNVVANGDVKATSVSLRHHIHDGVESGSGLTGQPVGG